MSVEEFGRRFAVRYVVGGTVRKLGNRIRVKAELIELAGQWPAIRYVWSGQCPALQLKISSGQPI